MRGFLCTLLFAWIRGSLLAVNGLLLGKYLSLYHGLPGPLWAWLSAAFGTWALRQEWRRARLRRQEPDAHKSAPGGTRDKAT